ncbi:MAG: hypothetical protein ACO21J_08225 [Anaerohalosphaeraceae bacterium]
MRSLPRGVEANSPESDASSPARIARDESSNKKTANTVFPACPLV